MTEIIVITGSILAIMGIGVAIWSFIDTRKRSMMRSIGGGNARADD